MNVNIEEPGTVAKICLGINSGYNNDKEPDNWYLIRTKIQDILKEAEAECGTYVSFTMVPGHVIYKMQWGCKHGGKPVALLEATRNSTFNSDENEWRRAVQCVARKLKEQFKQSTLTVSFQEADVVYMR